MVKPSQGLRRKTRRIMKKKIREKGAVPRLSYLLYEYQVGDKVHIVINPSVFDGMPHRRYHGKTGVIIGKRGYAYEVETYLGDKRKILFIRPEHLKPTPEVVSRTIENVKKLINEIRERKKELLKKISS
ncbi:MAG: 50S ribosomal protein L21e [Sulfolobales archaeon]